MYIYFSSLLHRVTVIIYSNHRKIRNNDKIKKIGNSWSVDDSVGGTTEEKAMMFN
jgi:hypothetical protein